MFSRQAPNEFCRHIAAGLESAEDPDLPSLGCSRDLYAMFTARHPRCWFVKRKEIGVALQPVPDSLGEFLVGKERNVTRTNRNRALCKGFRFVAFNPKARLGQILLRKGWDSGRIGFGGYWTTRRATTAALQ